MLSILQFKYSSMFKSLKFKMIGFYDYVETIIDMNGDMKTYHMRVDGTDKSGIVNFIPKKEVSGDQFEKLVGDVSEALGV